MPRKYFYYLSFEDIQTVAEEELDRRLTKKELIAVSDRAADYIPWFEAISEAINDVLEIKDEDKD